MTSPDKAHADQVNVLAKHVAYFEAAGDKPRAEAYAAELKHTADRAAMAVEAAALVDKLGLTDEVTPSTVTRHDAINFVSKVMHECAHGVKKSHYQRAHASVMSVASGAHVETAKMGASFDPVADVVEHLGLSDDKQVSLVKALFAAKKGA